MSETDRTKECRACHVVKSYEDFYQRTSNDGTKPGHYVSECRDCMKIRNSNINPVPKDKPRSPSEVTAIEQLTRMGIHALPGKAVSAADVDVVAWGCVWIEVKYAKVQAYEVDGSPMFNFNLTPTQQKRGLLGHLVMLMCDYGDRITYHIFRSDYEVWYKDGRLKTGFMYRVGQTNNTASRRQGVLILNDARMAEHQDRYDLIEAQRLYIASTLGA